MKTSIKLLIITACLALTGLVSVNALLKQEYDRINWNDPYQNYIKKSLPALRHVRIVGTPKEKVLVRQRPEASALLDPHLYQIHYQTSQKGDTLLINFTRDGDRWEGELKNYWMSDQAGLVVNLPTLRSLQAKNARVEIEGFQSEQLYLTGREALLTTEKLRISNLLHVQTEQGGFAYLNADSCNVLQITALDSAGMDLESIKPQRLVTNIAPKTEIRLKGDQLRKMQIN